MKSFKDKQKTLTILTELQGIIDTEFTDSSFNADKVNKRCSVYLFENKDKNYKNEDIFALLRFVVTGDTVGPPIADVMEVVGRKQVLKRISIAKQSDLFKGNTTEKTAEADTQKKEDKKATKSLKPDS